MMTYDEESELRQEVKKMNLTTELEKGEPDTHECGYFSLVGRDVLEKCLDLIDIELADYKYELVCVAFRDICHVLRARKLMSVGLDKCVDEHMRAFLYTCLEGKLLFYAHSISVLWDNPKNGDVETLEFNNKELIVIVNDVREEVIRGSYVGRCATCYKDSIIHKALVDTYGDYDLTEWRRWPLKPYDVFHIDSMVSTTKCSTCGDGITTFKFTIGSRVLRKYANVFEEATVGPRPLSSWITIKMVEDNEDTYIHICRPVDLDTYSCFRNTTLLVKNITKYESIRRGWFKSRGYDV
jgi:hypothetical protein